MTEETKSKPILCLDFDGVLHNYTTGWRGAKIISDGPVDGAMEFLRDAVELFTIHIYSSRSNLEGGISSMKNWLEICLLEKFGNQLAYLIFDPIVFPTSKPPAFVTIDDRAITFTGTFPNVDELLQFKPWNKT